MKTETAVTTGAITDLLVEKCAAYYKATGHLNAFDCTGHVDSAIADVFGKDGMELMLRNAAAIWRNVEVALECEHGIVCPAPVNLDPETEEAVRIEAATLRLREAIEAAKRGEPAEIRIDTTDDCIYLVAFERMLNDDEIYYSQRRRDESGAVVGRLLIAADSAYNPLYVVNLTFRD